MWPSRSTIGRGCWRARWELSELSENFKGLILLNHVSPGRPLPHNNPLLAMQGKYPEAASLYERSQTIRENMLGPEHPDFAQSLHNRAVLLKKQVRATGFLQ